ncbi:MAG: CRTAC1 family protein [Thermodesulfobacteriota bacterium]
MVRFGSNLFFIILLSAAVGVPVDPAASAEDVPGFVNVQKESGVYIGGPLGHAAVWGDYNNDGWQDILLSSLTMLRTTKSKKKKNSEAGVEGGEGISRDLLLFMNVNGGSFTETTGETGLPDLRAKAASWADYDNDGYLDVAVMTIMAGKPPILFKNSKKFSFADVSEKAGLTIEGPNPSQVLWVDYDNDGSVDLFQAGTGGSLLYRNKGDGTFGEVSGPAGLGVKARTNGAVWFDSNNDGFQDLFLANTGTNAFYLNKGDGTFADYTEKSGLSGEASWRTTAACTGDYNGDGYLDIYVTNLGPRMRNALYRNNGDGTFTDVTSDTGTADAGDGRTCAWVDFDADGDVDLFTTNHVHPNKLYLNSGKGAFTDVAPEAGIDLPKDVFAATWGDYNRDGYIDVFLNGHIGTGLMKNNGNSNYSIVLKLEGDGKKSNRSAVGARAAVSTPAGVQIREVSGGRGCCEQDMLPLYFGLGKEKVADVEITWPSGKTCSFKGVSVEKVREYTISEMKCGINPSS